ncbi:hypothetical protein Q4512_03520 [Oceanihabitans sp. 2_MG-2023]|uniref:hypothetical protein n=1 Tax=Oceanihabitans sp. 2_MG-2023 TaxID=3062661 RepID=UPI0026E275E0|nr:hypothetical protein [Oceanihabitans sp. 2_MG-2023]MDO6595969.1 hypothetical protein [Oceanihabitans sp. 2_MG-2023]
MKKFIKNTLVIAVLFTTLLANANAPLNPLNDARRTTLTLNNVKEGNELLIKNTLDIVIYKELIENSGDYTKGFDLTALPNGEYFFELVKDSEIKIIPFHVSNNMIAFNNGEESTIFIPSIRNKENKVYISKLSLNQQPLNVEVFYEDIENNDFHLIYSEKIEDSSNIARVLNLDENKKGRYRIVTKTEGRTFVDYIQF